MTGEHGRYFVRSGLMRGILSLGFRRSLQQSQFLTVPQAGLKNGVHSVYDGNGIEEQSAVYKKCCDRLMMHVTDNMCNHINNDVRVVICVVFRDCMYTLSIKKQNSIVVFEMCTTSTDIIISKHFLSR